MISNIWYILVVYAGGVLLVRYLVQFGDLGDYIRQLLWIKLDVNDSGLEKYYDKNMVFIRLIGNSLILLFSVWQMRLFIREKRSHDRMRAIGGGQIRLSKMWSDIHGTARRFAAMHLSKIGQLLFMIATILRVDGAHGVYLVMSLFFLFDKFPSLIIMAYASFMLIAESMLQMKVMDSWYVCRVCVMSCIGTVMI